MCQELCQYWSDNGEQKQTFAMLLRITIMEKYMIQYDFLVDNFDLLIKAKLDFPRKVITELRSEG